MEIHIYTSRLVFGCMKEDLCTVLVKVTNVTACANNSHDQQTCVVLVSEVMVLCTEHGRLALPHGELRVCVIRTTC